MADPNLNTAARELGLHFSALTQRRHAERCQPFNLADEYAAVSRRPTVSDDPMSRVYPSNVTRTSLAGLRRVDYARPSSSTGMERTPAVWRAYSAKPG
jgi:hypothetical protein